VVNESASPAAPVAQERALEPRSIGRYMDLGEIASGGMASVHFGRLTGHAGFAREVAIKRLHPHLASDPEFVAMLLDEARLAGRVVHANVVPTLDVVVENEDVFVVMEYVRGLTLSQLFKILHSSGQRIPLRIASAIIIGVLHGLHAAHDATDDRGTALEIVHRDVSPHNILIGIDGVARLLDFGIAKAAVRLQTTQDGRVKGKIAYMSPEQVQGGRVTRRADIYAAAVVLWEAVTGERLYRGENEASIILRVVSADVKPPSRVVPELPHGLDEIIRRGTARSAADRYATAREMASALDRAVPGASAAEIGEWLAKVGVDALVERAQRIAELERVAAGESTTLELNGPVSMARSRLSDSASAPPEWRTHTPARHRSELSTVNEIATASGVASTTSGVASSSAHEPLTRATAWGRHGYIFLTLAITVSLGAIVLSIGYRATHGRTAGALAPTISPSPSSVAVPPLTTEMLPPADQAGSTLPDDRADPPKQAERTASDPPPSPSAHVHSKHHAHSSKCAPSSVDSAGHTHFNPACL
jgi:eukaryotic-like serine/threonine-protein kinase